MSIKTNINKTKGEIILELVCSFNQGGRGYFSERVDDAINQYNQLVEAGIIVEFPPKETESSSTHPTSRCTEHAYSIGEIRHTPKGVFYP